MKKFLCMTCMLLFSMLAMAHTELNAYSPPDSDVGMYEMQQCTQISQDGLTFEIVNVSNVGDWQAPVMLNMEESAPSAQVADAFIVATQNVTISVALDCLRCPITKKQAINGYNHKLYSDCGSYSFRPQRTDI